MKFQVVTLFPEMVEAACAAGVVGQAQKKSLIQVSAVNPRSFTEDVHKTVDDRPFGGGDGMVMLADPLEKSLKSLGCKAISEDLDLSLESDEAYVIYLSPQGETLTDRKALELSQRKNVVLLCGRYGGVDQRVLNRYVAEELSIGDYVLSGGELAACVVVDAVSRKIPGVLGHDLSAAEDSFSENLEGLLEAPSFTRPQDWQGNKAPEILLSGNHQKIDQWRKHVSKLVTLAKRPDLVFDQEWSSEQVRELKAFWVTMSEQDKHALGLAFLTDEDIDLL